MRVAVAQASSSLLDPTSTLAKALALIEEAAAR